MKKKNLLMTFLLAALILGGGAELFAQKTLPYSYGFEFTGTYNATNAANALTTEGWTLTNASSATMIKQYMYNNGKSFCFYVDESKDYQYLVSPLLSDASSINIDFLWRVSSSTSIKFQIGYSKSDTPDVATNFTWSDPVTASNITTYTLASQSYLTEGIKYIAIKFDRNSETATYRYFAIDEITISIAPPSNIVASPMTTLATLSWTGGYNEIDWLLYYSSTNTAPTDYTTNVITVETNPTYTITGLTKDEPYYAWVCAENNGIYSAWVGPVEFTPADEFTLTVYNGTTGQAGAPFHYNTTNSNVKSQFIIPSTELTYLINKQITDLQFYHSVANQSWGDAKFEIYMKEFDSKTTFSSNDDYTDWSTMTKVYDGNASFSTDGNKIMAIELTNPYVYAGGNLMIGFKIIATGSSLSYCSWNGVSQSTAANNTCICYTTYNTGFKWLPKITFTSQCITFDNCSWGTGATPTMAQNVEVKNDVTVSNGTNAFANIIEMGTGSTFTIGNGATLTCNNIAGTTTANLTIEDGGRLIVYNTGVQATVKKEISGVGNENWNAPSGADGWYFIASPVNGAAFPTGSVATQDIYQLDWANSQWLNLQNDAHNSLLDAGFQRGTGYLYASKGGNTISVAGEIQPLSGSDNATVTLATTGWNLIGNPLTCKVTVDKAFSELNNASSVTNQDAGAAINPFQGIAVYGTAGDVVTFTKATSQNAVAPSNNALQMTLSQTVASRGTISSEVVDNAIVKFNGNSSLPKFSMLEGKAKLYIPQNGEDYAIVSSEAQGEMPVNFKANENGQYTLTVNAENVEMNYLHLIDNLTGADIDLMANPSYTFNANASDHASRFRIVFSGNGVEENLNENDNFAFIGSDGQLVVSGTGTIQILDMMGRVISTKSTEENISTNGMASGVYVLRLIGNETKTQKIVVR